jgi:NADH-quinone oxidoreductase subunit G
MRANISVHEPRASQDIDSALSFSMEGYRGTQEPSSLVPFAWAPGWNSPQAWNKFQDEVGGHLKAGDPGVRLIQPTGKLQAPFQPSENLLAPFSLKAISSLQEGEKVSVPLYHLFGSEELSNKASPVESQRARPYVAISLSVAHTLGVSAGDWLEIMLKEQSFKLAVEIHPSLAAAAVGLPAGLVELPWLEWNVPVTLKKAENV